MTTKKSTRGARAPQPKLSTPANARAIFALISVPAAGSDTVFQAYHDLIDQAGVDSTSPETFRLLWRRATRAVEGGGESKGARRAYDELAEVLRRVRAGESLQDIEAERQRKLAESVAENKRRELAKPEPKDKLSDEWRYWKLRQVERLTGYNSDTEASDDDYRAGWKYITDLIRSLVNNTPDFWRLDFVMPILADLISARQHVAAEELRDKRMRAGMKAAATRKANKAKGA